MIDFHSQMDDFARRVALPTAEDVRREVEAYRRAWGFARLRSAAVIAHQGVRSRSPLRYLDELPTVQTTDPGNVIAFPRRGDR
jgi:hypothetical protein